MKSYFIYILLAVLLLTACTKEEHFFERPTLTGLVINTTSPSKTFEVWLDDELLQDSVNQKKFLDKHIKTGEHRLRIAHSTKKDYFVDTLMNFEWIAQKQYQFSLIEIDVNTAPFLFTGFPSDLPIPQIGYSTIGVLNTDQTLSLNKTIDLIFYDRISGNTIVELKDIPYATIKYFEVSDAIRVRGYVVLKDTSTGEIIYDGRGGALVTLYSADPRYNTYLISLSNSQGTSNPQYNFGLPLISFKR